MISICRLGLLCVTKDPSTMTSVTRNDPYCASERLRNSTVWCPSCNCGVDIAVPLTAGITIASPSMNRVTLAVPIWLSIWMDAPVPLKENATPVLGQVRCSVSPLTRPINRHYAPESLARSISSSKNCRGENRESKRAHLTLTCGFRPADAVSLMTAAAARATMNVLGNIMSCVCKVKEV